MLGICNNVLKRMLFSSEKYNPEMHCFYDPETDQGQETDSEPNQVPLVMPQPRKPFCPLDILQQQLAHQNDAVQHALVQQTLVNAPSKTGRCRFTKFLGGEKVRCESLSVPEAKACKRHKCHQCILPMIEGADGTRACPYHPLPQVSPHDFLMTALEHQEGNCN